MTGGKSTGDHVKQPYLIAIGAKRSEIYQFYVAVDQKAIPCDTSILGAMDTLFKAHYVFGLQYSEPLHNFWVFIQTTLYGLDRKDTNEAPRILVSHSPNGPVI